MTPQPNILLIMSDQLQADALGFAGATQAHTPHHDRLAAEGAQFTRCYATNPTCAPSRSSFFFGRFPCETGAVKNELYPRAGLPTIGTQLKQAGYQCDYVGKWNLYPSMTYRIPGFSVPVSGINNNSYCSDIIVTNACVSVLQQHGQHASQQQQAQQPFFLSACYQQPHDVCQWLAHHGERIEDLAQQVPEDQLPPLPDNFNVQVGEPRYVKEFRRTRCVGVLHNWSERAWRYYRWCYDQQVACMDAHLGQLLEELDASGQADNTVVICCSDHGEGLGYHRLQIKGTCYDEHLRVPMLVRWPGHIAAGSRLDLLASALDLMPTCCELAGAPYPTGYRGQSWLSALCRAQQNEPPEGTTASGEKERAVFAETDTSNARMVRTDRWKYTYAADDGYEQLFDMAADPDETINLADDVSCAIVLNRHRQLLADWEAGHELAPELTPLVLPPVEKIFLNVSEALLNPAIKIGTTQFVPDKWHHLIGIRGADTERIPRSSTNPIILGCPP